MGGADAHLCMLLTLEAISIYTITRVKVFMIIPKFRILRQKVSLEMLNQRDHNSFSDLFSVCLRTFDHLNLKL